MATPRRKFEDLTPEQKAKVEAARAKWTTPEAREAEIHHRELLAEEHRLTGRIAKAGSPIDPEDEQRLRDLARELRERREKAKLSLAVVAERSGIDQGALSRLENGLGNPTFLTLSRYCRAIGEQMTWGFQESR